MGEYINYLWLILQGLGITLALFSVVIIISIPLGFIFTLLTRSKIPPISWLMKSVIYILRGTPLMLQLLFVYFGLSSIPFIGQFLTFDRFSAACIAFVLNYAAYLAEIYRGGLLSVDKGQYEAAQVLGFTKFQTMTRVIVPQMIRVSMPAIGNEAVTLVKDTALVFSIGIAEITHITKGIVSKENDPSVFIIAAAVYLVINMILTFIFKKIEKSIDYNKGVK